MDSSSLPAKEIEDIFNLHHSISQQALLSLFDIVIEKISKRVESIHLSVFTLEQNIKGDDYKITDLNPLESNILQVEPCINSLVELSEIISNKGIEKGQQQITKIQSEWSSLQHFLSSVKKQVMASNEQKELTVAVETLLIQMDDTSTLIFDFYERKHASAIQLPASSSSDSEKAYSESTSTTTNELMEADQTTKWLQNNKDDQLMADIDHAYEPILQTIETLYHRINKLETANALLHRRFVKVKEKWEILQFERDELKFEHKEDRWLAVFRRVADQVDVMIDGLDRSVVQCYSIIQQAKDWQNNNASSPNNVFDKFSKSFLRTFHHSTTTTTNQKVQPVDKEKFRSVEKSFEAKYKYYTPSIDRMLAMLGNGISARASRDNQTSQRHDSMIQRWNHLKEVMDELRMRDLIETERILNYTSHSSTNSTSSESSRNSTAWKGIRYKTPEPKSYDENRRSVTPNSAYAGRNSLGRSSPRNQSLLRASISDSSSVGSQPQLKTSPSRQTKTPRPTRNISTNTKKEDFYDEDERYYGVDLMKLTNMNKPPVTNQHYIRSASTLERKRSQNLDRITSTVRSKTPNPPTSTTTRRNIRSKSSMGDLMTNRVMSPRSTTPSLIPRPKTPKDERSPSPMIPRPRSQMRNTLSKPPPVPPIPKYVISHENDYAQYRDPHLSRKKSMPALTSRNASHIEISFNEDCIYRADPKDPLDQEVGHIVNASPISIKCVRAQQGRYYFGNELSMSSMGGKKMYTCKLMTYSDRRGGQYKNNKVLIRVGGGWQDLEFFLLEHSSFMASDVVVKSFGQSTRTVM